MIWKSNHKYSLVSRYDENNTFQSRHLLQFEPSISGVYRSSKKKFCMRRVLVVFTVWKQENKARTKEILVKILANNSPFPPHSGSTLFLVIHVNEFHLIETNTHETLLTYPLFREPWSLFSWIQNLLLPPPTPSFSP